MPTSLPRINVPFEIPTYRHIRQIAKKEGLSVSQVVKNLVSSALVLAEDLALAQVAQERLATFRKKEALTTYDMLKWSKSIKRKRK
ncbi:antitoxin, RHH family protein [Elusimicrobiota bacterium]